MCYGFFKKLLFIIALMDGIKNIIFDLGGVLIDVDYHKTEEAFVQLGVPYFHKMFKQDHSSELFELLETGKISETDFYDAFRKETETVFTNQQIEFAWNAMLGDFWMNRIEWLEEIKTRYKIYLFSNTNIIHYKCFDGIFGKQFQHQHFNSLFIKAYYSHELGMRKPYTESYLHILREQGLNPSETLFIDDTIKNIEGAKKVGLQTIHLDKGQSLIALEV